MFLKFSGLSQNLNDMTSTHKSIKLELKKMFMFTPIQFVTYYLKVPLTLQTRLLTFWGEVNAIKELLIFELSPSGTKTQLSFGRFVTGSS